MSDRLVSHDIKYRTERSDVKHGHSGTRADGVLFVFPLCGFSLSLFCSRWCRQPPGSTRLTVRYNLSRFVTMRTCRPVEQAVLRRRSFLHSHHRIRYAQ